MKPSDWQLSKDEKENKQRNVYTGDDFARLPVDRNDCGMWFHLSDGSYDLHQNL